VLREPARWSRGGALVLVLAGALLLAACGSTGGSASSTSSSAATATRAVTISNFMFSPMTASVAPGATVRVTNKDSVTHTLTATGGQFDTGDIGPGQTKTFTAPSKAGTYSYICNIHQYMKGSIVVR
jgi:plastocyanin